MQKLLALAAIPAAAFATALAAQPPAKAWQIGPVIKGRNYSVGMPPTLEAGRNGPSFAFPRPDVGHVHYVRLAIGPLEGARSITVRYRVDAEAGTRFVAQESRDAGTFGLAFQRARDNWSAKGRYEAYRWYSPTTVLLEPGVHTFTARLNDPSWISVYARTSGSNPQGFREALADTESVSLTFGGSSGRGHGVFATKPAKFTILDFRID